MSRNVWNSLLGSFMIGTDLIKQYEAPLVRMLHNTLEDNHIQWHPPLIRHCTNLWPYYWLDLITEFDFITEYRFPWGICNGCGMPTGDAYSSGHLVPSLWDLHMFYVLRPILFRTCRYFTGLCSSNIPRYFLDFAFYQIAWSLHRRVATGAACQERTLTPPDTWSCRALGLACVLILRPISPQLVLFPDFWVSNIPFTSVFSLEQLFSFPSLIA